MITSQRTRIKATQIKSGEEEIQEKDSKRSWKKEEWFLGGNWRLWTAINISQPQLFCDFPSTGGRSWLGRSIFRWSGNLFFWAFIFHLGGTPVAGLHTTVACVGNARRYERKEKKTVSDSAPATMRPQPVSESVRPRWICTFYFTYCMYGTLICQRAEELLLIIVMKSDDELSPILSLSAIWRWRAIINQHPVT